MNTDQPNCTESCNPNIRDEEIETLASQQCATTNTAPASMLILNTIYITTVYVWL